MKDLLYNPADIMEVSRLVFVHIVEKKSPLAADLDIGIWGMKGTRLEINHGAESAGQKIADDHFSVKDPPRSDVTSGGYISLQIAQRTNTTAPFASI